MQQTPHYHCFKPVKLTLPLLLMLFAFFVAAFLP